jgi:ligand-binding sensor domain-containing protein/signal transduction histidine kinase
MKLSFLSPEEGRLSFLPKQKTTLTKCCSILVIVLIYSGYLAAQDPAIKHFTVKDGLPSATIYGSIKDKQGFLWFGTDAGVVRFDGRKFITYTLADGLSDNEILNVFQDSKHRIWFLGFNGTVSYYLDGKFFNPENSNTVKKIVCGTSFNSAFEDRNGVIYFSSLNDYLILKDEAVKLVSGLQLPSTGVFCNNSKGAGVFITTGVSNKPVIYKYGDGKLDSFRCRYSRHENNGYTYDLNGNLLFSSKQGLVRQRDTLQELLIPFPKRIESFLQYGILHSSKNRLWVAVSGEGLHCYDYGDLRAAPKTYLKKMNVASILEDHEGNIWVGTLGQGIYMLPNWHEDVQNYSIANGLPFNEIISVVKDQEGDVYVGSKAATLYRLNNSSFSKVMFADRVHEFNRVLKLLSEDDRLWIVTDMGLYVRQSRRVTNIPVLDSEGLNYQGSYKDIAIFGDDVYLAGSYMLYHLKLQNGGVKAGDSFRPVSIHHKRTFCVYASKNGAWYGTSLGLFNLQNGIEKNLSGSDYLLTKRINDIAETDDGTLILATYGYGVLFYHNGVVKRQITEKDGLVSNSCRRLFLHKKDIYVTTSNGISKISLNGNAIATIENYTTSAGLVSNDVNDVFVDDREIIAATSSGASVIKSSVIQSRGVVPPPPLYLQKATSDKKMLAIDSANELDYADNHLKIDYIALSYHSPEKVRYRYRLSAATPWTETHNNSIELASLSPGEYKFEVQAKLGETEWTAAKTFSFAIQRPYWQRTWFIIISCLIVLTSVVLLVLWQSNSLRRKRLKKLEMQHQIVQLEQQALQAMMNPHFIFNVMNSIQQYINSNDVHAANIYLAEFARLIRINLDLSTKRYISLEEEINYLNLYLQLESLRFKEQFTYHIDVDPNLDPDETSIPVMVIQPFIENAIWHGMLKKKDQGHIQVNFRQKSDRLLLVEVIDNGNGIPEELERNRTHESLGLKLIKQRLRLIGKIHGHQLEVKLGAAFPDQSAKGVKVELVLPSDLG